MYSSPYDCLFPAPLFILFAYLLQNHTLTTSFSIDRELESMVISSELGFGFCRKARSRATRTLVSIDVLFFRRRPRASGEVNGLLSKAGSVTLLSASFSHFCSKGFSLHMFLKERLRASNRLMVVCEKSFPYNLPIARPTSPWVNPNLIRLCLNVLANCSSSSRSVVSSGIGSQDLLGGELGPMGRRRGGAMWFMGGM